MASQLDKLQEQIDQLTKTIDAHREALERLTAVISLEKYNKPDEAMKPTAPKEKPLTQRQEFRKTIEVKFRKKYPMG